MRRNKDWSDVFVNIEGKKIDTPRSEKLCGVVVHQDLSWHKHLYMEMRRTRDWYNN